jgi:hypothetical protein
LLYDLYWLAILVKSLFYGLWLGYLPPLLLLLRLCSLAGLQKRLIFFPGNYLGWGKMLIIGCQRISRFFFFFLFCISLRRLVKRIFSKGGYRNLQLLLLAIKSWVGAN